MTNVICNLLLVEYKRGFMSRYFNKKDKGNVNVTLGVLDGRTWPVTYASRASKLSKGRTTFARDNYLKMGDVCFFELIEGNTNFLKLVVFRTRRKANC